MLLSAGFNMPANLELSSGHRTGKDQLSFQSQRRAVPQNVQTTAQLCSFHLVERQYSKSFKPGFNSTWMENFQMFKLVLEKVEEPEIKFPTPTGSQKNQGNSRKASASLTTWNPLCGSQQTVEYSSRDGNTRPHYLTPEKPIFRPRSNN